MSGVVRFSTRVDATTPAHTTIRLFVNGASAGLLTMRKDEFRAFVDYLAMRDEAIDILDELAADPSSARTSYLAHRAARALGIQCQVMSFCKSCDEERNEAAEERANYGSAA